MQSRPTLRKINQFTGHSGSIYGLYYSKATGKAFTGASDGLVVEWDLANPEAGKVICRLNQPVYCILLIESTQQLWIGVAKGNIHVVDLSSKAEIKNLSVHQSGVFDLKLLDNKIYAAGGDGCLSVFDMHSFELLQLRKFSEKSARVIAIHPGQSLLAIGFSDCSILLVDRHLQWVGQEMHAHDNSVFSLQFCRNGNCLISGGRDAKIKVWEMGLELKLLKDIPAHNLHVQCISVQEEGEYFVSSSMDKSIKIWGLEDFELLRVVDFERNESHTNSVNKIAWINFHEFLSISDDKKMMHWELIS